MTIQRVERQSQQLIRIKPLDNIATICSEYNTTRQNIDNIPLIAGKWLLLKNTYKTIHIVKPIESLCDIAKRYGTTIERIMIQNHLNTDRLFIGQRIVIE